MILIKIVNIEGNTSVTVEGLRTVILGPNDDMSITINNDLVGFAHGD